MAFEYIVCIYCIYVSVSLSYFQFYSDCYSLSYTRFFFLPSCISLHILYEHVTNKTFESRMFDQLTSLNNRLKASSEDIC